MFEYQGVCQVKEIIEMCFTLKVLGKNLGIQLILEILNELSGTLFVFASLGSHLFVAC